MDVMSWGKLHLFPEEAYWYFGLASVFLLFSMSLIRSSGGTSPWEGIIPMSTSSSTSSCCLAYKKHKCPNLRGPFYIWNAFTKKKKKISYEHLLLLDPWQPWLSELFDEVCVNLSMLLPLLLLLLSKSIAGVQIAIAGDTSKYGPEEDKDRNDAGTHKDVWQLFF